MELFRSESMQLVQFIVPAEAAHDTVLALGEIVLVQFKDQVGVIFTHQAKTQTC